MGNADALSRLPLPCVQPSEPEELVLMVDSRMIDAKMMAYLIATDPALSRVLQKVHYI